MTQNNLISKSVRMCRRSGEKIAFAVSALAFVSVLLGVVAASPNPSAVAVDRAVRLIESESQAAHESADKVLSPWKNYSAISMPDVIDVTHTVAPGNPYVGTVFPIIDWNRIKRPDGPTLVLPTAIMLRPEVKLKSVVLKWAVAVKGTESVEQYVLERKDPGSDAWVRIATIDPSTLNHEDRAPLWKRAYKYRIVVTTNKEGSTTSPEVEAVIPAQWRFSVLTASDDGAFIRVEKQDADTGRVKRTEHLYRIGDPIGDSTSRLEKCAPITMKIARRRCDKTVRTPHLPVIDRQPYHGMELVYKDPDDGATVRLLRPDPSEGPNFKDQLCPLHLAEKMLLDAAREMLAPWR